MLQKAEMPLDDGKAAILAEPARLAKYIMSIYDFMLSGKVGDPLCWRSMPVKSTLDERQQ